MKKALLFPLLTASALMAKEVSLLDDHLRMELPDNAICGERTTALMDALPGNGETLYWIGVGDDRIAIHATELFRFAEPDFMDIAFKDMKNSAPEDNEVGTIGDNIVYAIIAPDATPKDDINVYGEALVRSADGMVQRVQFLFSRNVAKDIPAARKLIMEALTSLKPGEGGPDISARTVTFAKHPPSYKANHYVLSLPLPAGYYFTHQKGVDFELYFFKEVDKSGSHGSGIRMYVGHYPGKNNVYTSDTTRKGKLLGKDVTWQLFPGEPGKKYYSACLISPLWATKRKTKDGGYVPDYIQCIQITVYAETPEKRDELISVVEAMTREPLPKK